MRADARLAEGPRWDAVKRRLLWVDIEGCELHVFESGADRAIRLDAMVGAAAPTTGGPALVALADRLALVDLADGSVRTLVTLPPGPALRSDDGACDAAGRFGGDGGDSLFVTTAAPDGNVYVTQPGLSGPPAHVFHVGATRTAPSDAEDTSAR